MVLNDDYVESAHVTIPDFTEKGEEDTRRDEMVDHVLSGE